MGVMQSFIPGSNWSTFFNLIHFYLGSLALQLLIVDDIVTTNCFFSVSKSGDFIQLQTFLAILLCQALLTRNIFNIISDFIPGFFVFLSEILLIESLFIIYFHCHWIVHQAVALNSDGKLLHLILAMNIGFSYTFRMEIGFFSITVIFAIHWVEIMSFPIFLRGFSSHNTLISNNFLIMMLQVLVRYNIVIFKVLMHILLDMLLILLTGWSLIRSLIMVFI